MRGQHSVMMTATSTESDANSSPAYEREMPTQPHLLHSPLPTMDVATITATSTGAAVPIQEQEQTPEEAGLGPEQEREQETDVTSMIAREGSELARRLRESGWIARNATR